MNLLSSKKAIFSILSLGTVVFAGTMNDINSRSVSKNHEVVTVTPVERYVASDVAVEQKVAVMRIEMNEASRVNGNWEITRIVGADQVVSFDKLNNVDDQKKSIKVPLKLVGTSKVMVNKDQALVYNISLLSDFGTIAIFKKIGNGYEIIEARRIKEKKQEVVAQNEEVELVLERALNQNKSNKVLTGSDAMGEMLLKKDSIESLSVTLANTNGEVQNVEFSVIDLMDGGAFKAEVDGEEVSGIVFPNGENSYRMSFVTGPLAGAMLNFVTRDVFEKNEDSRNESNDYYEVEKEQSAEMAQADIVEERRVLASAETHEEVQILSADEINEITQTQGFAF